MDNSYVTIIEIAKETNIPASTVRRYLDQHNHTLRTKRSSRGAWMLKEEDIPLVREIRSCYEKKMSSDEVDDHLPKSGQPLTVQDEEDQELTITPAAAFMKLAEEINRLQEETSSANQQLSSAHEEIRQLKEAQETASEQRKEETNALMEEMKAMSEGIKRLEVEKEEREKKENLTFWSKLFGKNS